MRLEIVKNLDSTIIKGVDAFNLENTLLCGQAFRWEKVRECFKGVIYGKHFSLRQAEDCIVADAPLEDGDIDLLVRYLCLDTDHREIEERLKRIDSVLSCAIERYPGIRILRQDPWETLISFIISARNSIPSIRRCINLLSERFGRLICEDADGRRYYSFPSPEELAKAEVDDIVGCGASFRGKYIYETTRMILDGKVDLDAVKGLPSDEGRTVLQTLPGVGPKIADCVLLFAMEKYDVFPIDVWMNRVMRFIYMDGAEVKLAEMQRFARERFGELAGFAQEYLYYYARSVIADELRDREG